MLLFQNCGALAYDGTAFSPADGDSKADVVILSTREKTIAISKMENGRLTFPHGIPLDKEPAVFDLVDGPVEFVDTRNNKRNGTKKLVPVLTVKAGRPFGRPPLPIPFTF